MFPKNLNLFWKIIIILFVLGVVVLLCGRNHFMLGTILIMLRWILVVFGIAIFYLTLKRVTPKQFKIPLIICVLLIPSEYVWNKLHEKNLKEGGVLVEVSLMTYNVFFKNSSPDSSLTKIRNYNPDILVIQELTPDWNVKLERSIGRQYPHKKILALRGTHGIGVYSKYPITDSKVLGDNNRPYAQILELNINDRKVQLINVHLASPAIAVEHPENFLSLFSSNYKLRRQQLESINSIANKAEPDFDAQLLMGDLNTTRYEPLYRDITNQWIDLYDVAGSGWGFNFPNSKKLNPVITLDYVFGRGVIKGIDLKVVTGGSSDHLALAGKVKI